MTELFIIGGLIDFLIMWYTYHFLSKVGFYPCVKEKMGENILMWRWVVVLGGIVAGFMPYYSFRAIFMGFDTTTKLVTILQLLVWIFGIKLYYFHIKTTSNEKVV